MNNNRGTNLVYCSPDGIKYETLGEVIESEPILVEDPSLILPISSFTTSIVNLGCSLTLKLPRKSKPYMRKKGKRYLKYYTVVDMTFNDLIANLIKRKGE